MRISHEAIYQALYVQGRGALKRELVACLRTGRALRVPRARTRQRGRKFVSPEIMITQRPAEAEDRAVPGHWEGDLIPGLRSSAIGTLVERTTRFTMLLHLPPMPGPVVLLVIRDRHMFWKILLPGAVPFLASGLRIAVQRALIAVIVAEFLIGVPGLGFVIRDARAAYHTDRLFAMALLLMVLGAIMIAITKAVEARLSSWRPKAF